METIIIALFMGVIATVIMDIWSALLPIAFSSISKADWGPVGRWAVYLFRGQFIHRPSIMESKEVLNESAIGWGVHYLTGILYAVGYMMILHLLNASPSMLSALLFGIVTVLAPWFIMLPGFGMGVCARKIPKSYIILIQSLLGHSVFGFSLYLGWMMSESLFN